MKTYEITFITKEEPKETVKSILESFGAKITKTSSLGQKTFVYPIKKEKSGVYTSYLFDIDPLEVQALNRKLDMEEEVIRHLIINLSPSEIAAGLQTKEAKSYDAAPEKTEIEVKPEMALEVEPEKAIEVAPVDEIVAVEEPAKEEKVDDLDKSPVAKPAKKTVKKASESKSSEAEGEVEKEEVVAEKSAKEKKTTKKAEKVEGVNEAANKAVNEVVNEEERLEALDKKLEELLKE